MNRKSLEGVGQGTREDEKIESLEIKGILVAAGGLFNIDYEHPLSSRKQFFEKAEVVLMGWIHGEKIMFLKGRVWGEDSAICIDYITKVEPLKK